MSSAATITAEQLKVKLEGASELQPVAECVVVDLSGGCGAKFDIIVVSDALGPVSILERHRLVQRILKDELAGVHATTFKLFTVSQAAAKRAAGLL